MRVRSGVVAADARVPSTSLLARLTARRDERRRRNLRVWALRLLAGTGGLWLLLVVVGSLTQSG